MATGRGQLKINSRFAEWLVRKWADIVHPENARHIYLKHLAAVFDSDPGKFILNVWISENYATMSMHPGQTEGELALKIAFNEGRRSFIHELLEDLAKIETPYPIEPEVITDDR